jgi:hypothetical protein
LEGLSALLGVILGAFLTYWVTAAVRRREETLVARLEVARCRSVVWQHETYLPISEHLASTRVRLTALGVDPELIDALSKAAEAAWRNGHESFEIWGDDNDAVGIGIKELNALAEAMNKVDASLAEIARPRLRWRHHQPA